jgi:phosphopantetheinyl transferase
MAPFRVIDLDALDRRTLRRGCSLAIALPRSPALQTAPEPERRAAVHAMLGSILGRLAGPAPESLRIARTERGKPYVEGIDGIRFNISHARSHSLLAFSRAGEIGCDIEDRITGDDAVKLSPLVLHPTERATLNRLPVPERQDAFRQLWVRKEAVLKASGSGFLDEPRRVIAGLDNARAAWSPGDGPRLHLHNQRIAAECVAAVAGNDAACDWCVFAI